MASGAGTWYQRPMSTRSSDKCVTDLLEARFASAPYADAEGILARFLDNAFAYSNETIGLADLRAAWDVFRVWVGSGVNRRAEDWRLFLAWYVFHWHSSSEEVSKRPELPSIAERYLRDRPDAVPPEVHLLVRSAIGTPLDFYEMLYLPEFERYYLKSLFLGYQQSFGFEALPEGLTVGDVYLAKIVHIYADQGLIAGISTPFHANAKVPIGFLRRNLIRNRATDFSSDFWLFDSDIFNLYQDLQHGQFGTA